MDTALSDSLLLQMAYERSKKWTEFLSETIKKKDTVILDNTELDFIEDNKSSSSSLSSMENDDLEDEIQEAENITNNATKGSSDSTIVKENANWSVDESVGVQQILNRTRCVLVESGMERVLDSFDLDEIEDKVGNWLRKNVTIQSKEVKLNTYSTPRINYKHLEHVSNDCDSDSDSFNSGDTARYILSNKTRHKCNPVRENTAIKNFCMMKSRRDALRQKYAFLNKEKFNCQQNCSPRQFCKCRSHTTYNFDHDNFCQHNLCCLQPTCRCQFNLPPFLESPFRMSHGNCERMQSCFQHCDTSNVNFYYKHAIQESDTCSHKRKYNSTTTTELARYYSYKCNLEKELQRSNHDQCQLSHIHLQRRSCGCDVKHMRKSDREPNTPSSKDWLMNAGKDSEDFFEMKQKNYRSENEVDKKEVSNKEKIDVDYQSEVILKKTKNEFGNMEDRKELDEKVSGDNSLHEIINKKSKPSTRKRKVKNSNKKNETKTKNTKELRKQYKLKNLNDSEEEIQLAIKLSKKTLKEERKRLKHELPVNSIKESTPKSLDNTFMGNIKKAVNSTTVKSKSLCEINQKNNSHTAVGSGKFSKMNDIDCTMVTSTSDDIAVAKGRNTKMRSEKILLYAPTDLSLVPETSLTPDNFTLTKEHLGTVIGEKMASKFFKYYLGGTQFNKNCSIYYIPPTELNATAVLDSDDSECDFIECQGMFGKLKVVKA